MTTPLKGHIAWMTGGGNGIGLTGTLERVNAENRGQGILFVAPIPAKRSTQTDEPAVQ
jgi:hypothetical protein